MYAMVSRESHCLKRSFKSFYVPTKINLLVMENHAKKVVWCNRIFAQWYEASRFVDEYAYLFHSPHFFSLKTKARHEASPKAGNFPACR